MSDWRSTKKKFSYFTSHCWGLVNSDLRGHGPWRLAKFGMVNHADAICVTVVMSRSCSVNLLPITSSTVRPEGMNIVQRAGVYINFNSY